MSLHIAEYALADFEREARAVTERAREGARKTLAAALARAEQLREESRRAGHERGLEEGKRAALAAEQERLRREADRSLQAIAAIERELARNRLLIAGQAKDEIVGLALAIAQRIVKTQVRCDPGALRSNVERAVELISRREGNVRIHVNPDDLELMEKFLPELRQSWKEGGRWEATPDKGIAQGGCRVYAEQCSVDADVAAQLEEIERILLPAGLPPEPTPPPALEKVEPESPPATPPKSKKKG